jgi:hypothetical protein
VRPFCFFCFRSFGICDVQRSGFGTGFVNIRAHG